MLTWKQKEAHQRLLLWAEAEGRIRTVEAMTEEERKLNPGAYARGNQLRDKRYDGYKYGSNGKGHKPKPHQALTVRAK